MTASPLPCAISPLHARSVAIVTLGGESFRVCARCQRHLQQDVEAFRRDWLAQQQGTPIVKSGPHGLELSLGWAIVLGGAGMLVLLMLWEIYG